MSRSVSITHTRLHRVADFRRRSGLLLAVVAAVPLAANGAEPADLGIEWVTVGNPGNAPDPATGRGAVAGVFQISKYEVTAGQYAAFLSAVAASDPHGLWHGGQRIDRAGKAGAFTYAAKKDQERMPRARASRACSSPARAWA